MGEARKRRRRGWQSKREFMTPKNGPTLADINATLARLEADQANVIVCHPDSLAARLHRGDLIIEGVNNGR